jgi:hypothetical protein
MRALLGRLQPGWLTGEDGPTSARLDEAADRTSEYPRAWVCAVYDLRHRPAILAGPAAVKHIVMEGVSA